MKKAKAARPQEARHSAKPSSVHASRSAVDLETVRELARIATEFDLAEVETDPSGRVRVARRVSGGHAAAPVPASPAALSLMPSAPAGKDDDTASVVASPFVGTFYRSPNPDSAPFVEVGHTVRKGQVVCIVEAMKLMNEIESELDGKVIEILVKNGEHVEYGQALFRIEKS